MRHRILVLQVIVLASMLFFFSACASKYPPDTSIEKPHPPSDLPEVYLNPESQYPNTLFITAVGVGDSRKHAQESALSTLSQQIEVQVTSHEVLSESLSQQESSDVSANFENNTSLDSIISSRSSQKIKSIQFGESYTTKEGEVYIIAYINRVTVGGIYAQQIEDTLIQIGKFEEESLKNEGIAQYAYLAQALRLSKENERALIPLEVISPSLGKTKSASVRNTTERISKKLSESARKIVIAVETTVNDNTDETLSPISKSIHDTIVNRLTDLQFSVNDNSTETPYLAQTSITWKENTRGKYPSIQWSSHVQLKKDGNTFVSHTEKGRSRAKNIAQAKDFAINDINKALQKSFSTYIEKKMRL